MAKQHQAGAYHRKILLRRQMLRFARDGAAYVPFIGDGDMTVDLYDERKVYGADMDSARVELARSRLAGSEVLVADCDGWPFEGRRLERIALADFDPYRDPYRSFQSFWSSQPKLTNPFVCCFTDGQRQALMRVGTWRHPDGTALVDHDGSRLNERRRIFHGYLTGQIWPWFQEYVKPWEMVHSVRYLHGWMIYWVAVLRKPTSRSASMPLVARRSSGALTPAKRRKVIDGVANGMRLTSIAAAIGVERQAITKELGRNEKFAADFADAEDQANEAVMEAIYQAAVTGNVQAARIWHEINGTGASGSGLPAPTEEGKTPSRNNRLALLNAAARGDPFDEETEIPDGYYD